MRWALPMFVLGATACAGCGGDDAAICDAAALETALATATAGSTVEMGACRISGSFVVPAGVALRGRGPAMSTIVAPADRPGLRAMPNAGLISDLRIESGGIIGIVAMGAGSLELQRIAVHSSLGVAAGFEGLTNLVIRDSTFEGNVTPQTASQLPPMVTVANGPAYGLVIVRATNATLEDVHVDHFAHFGAVFVESTTTWTRGTAFENVGTSVIALGGHATLNNVAIDHALRGSSLEPTYALVATSSATLDTAMVSASQSGDFGLVFAGGASGTQSGLEVHDNVRAGVWLQRARSVEIGGNLSNNKIGAIVALDSEGLVVRNARITATRVSPVISFPGVADGIHAVNTYSGVRVDGVELEDNRRAGVLFDLGGNALDAATFGMVTVTSSQSTSYGAIIQNGAAPAGWDSTVQRVGSVMANDPSFMGRLGTVSGIEPCYFPRDPLQSQGLSAIVGP